MAQPIQPFDKLRMQLDPPAEVTAFLDHLHANGQRVAECQIEWVEHPTKKGRWVGVVKVEDESEGSDEMSKKKMPK